MSSRLTLFVCAPLPAMNGWRRKALISRAPGHLSPKGESTDREVAVGRAMAEKVALSREEFCQGTPLNSEIVSFSASRTSAESAPTKAKGN